MQELWQLICLFLLHPHMWIRKLCSRLLGMYLEACPQPDSEIFKLEVMSRVVRLHHLICNNVGSHAEFLICSQVSISVMCTVDKEQGQQYARKHGARALSVSVYPISSAECESSLKKFTVAYSLLLVNVGRCSTFATKLAFIHWCIFKRAVGISIH